MTAARAGRGRAARIDDAAGAPAVGDDSGDVLALAHPDWLYHHLSIAGDADLVTLFRQAAAGPGAIPWRDDLGHAEEDWFHLLAAPPEPQRRSVSLHGARVLAGQLRDAVERRREQAAAWAGRGGARSTSVSRDPEHGQGSVRPHRQPMQHTLTGAKSRSKRASGGGTAGHRRKSDSCRCRWSRHADPSVQHAGARTHLLVSMVAVASIQLRWQLYPRREAPRG